MTVIAISEFSIEDDLSLIGTACTTKHHECHSVAINIMVAISCLYA